MLQSYSRYGSDDILYEKYSAPFLTGPVTYARTYWGWNESGIE
jgi:hypothetical protein